MSSTRITLCALLGLLGCDASVPDEPATPAEDYGQLDPLASTCVGDGDGVLRSDEVPAVDLASELRLAMMVNPVGATVTLPPGWLSEGAQGFVADLSAARLPPAADDRLLFLGPTPVQERWYAPRFPDAQWSALIDADTGTDGLFARVQDGGEDAVVLLGVASTTPEETALRYTPPVPLFVLPMQDGDSWEVAAAAEGLADGVEYPADQGANGTVNLVHRWAFELDGSGVVALPAATLPALRLRLALRTEAYNSIVGLFAADSARAIFFVAECAGTVLRLRSQPDALDPDFAVATEVLRFGLAPELLP